MLFGVPTVRDATGTCATDPEGVLATAVRDVVAEVGDALVVQADLCLDEFTDHGHCGVVGRDGAGRVVVDNDETLRRYALMAQAQAAASRATTFLAKDSIKLSAITAKVDTEHCVRCLTCVRACPFDIPFINADGYSEIDPAKCHGFGVCAAECPAKAIQLMQYEDDQIMAKLMGLLERVN